MSDIRECFEKNPSGVFMAHLVAGYPSMTVCMEVAQALSESGADMLEVQIPFTDPLADGPAIMDACSISLEAGTTPDSVFAFVSKLTDCSDVPVVIMTYCSIPLKMGLQRFTEKAAGCGAAGLIIPDLPFDSEEGELLRDLCFDKDLSLIPVVSPGMDQGRLLEILSEASSFVYATLKVGITGSSRSFDAAESFLKKMSELTDLPVVAGFGISEAAEAAGICSSASGAVVGSHLLRLFNSSGIQALREFSEEVSSLIQKGGR